MAWWLLLSWAWATPVALPAGADAAQWHDVLALVGLEPGAVDDDGVRLVAGASAWTVEVRWEGRVRRADVPPPVTRADREDVAQLAASLLRGLEAPALPGLPELPELPPAPAPAAPRPAPAPRARPPAPALPPEVARAPWPELLPAVASGVARGLDLHAVALPAAEAVVVSVPEPASGPAAGWAFWGGPGLDLRSTVQPAVAGQAWGGWARGPLTVALGAEGVAPAALTRLSVERRVGSLQGGGGLWLASQRLGPRLGLGALGLMAWRPFEGVGADGGVAVPVAALEAVVELPGSGLRGAIRVARDLRVTELYVDAVREQVFEPWNVGLWVDLVVRSGGDRASDAGVR